MFIDEMFEDLLINQKKMYADACVEVCNEKLKSKADWNLTTIKRIENGYQCCVRRYPALNPHAFKIYVNYRAPEISKQLGWDKIVEKKDGGAKK
jgi:hypothetical protein